MNSIENYRQIRLITGGVRPINLQAFDIHVIPVLGDSFNIKGLFRDSVEATIAGLEACGDPSAKVKVKALKNNSDWSN